MDAIVDLNIIVCSDVRLELHIAMHSHAYMYNEKKQIMYVQIHQQ